MNSILDGSYSAIMVASAREKRDFWAFFGALHIVRERAWRANEAELTLETRLAGDRLGVSGRLCGSDRG